MSLKSVKSVEAASITIVCPNCEPYHFVGEYCRELESENWHYYRRAVDGVMVHYRKDGSGYIVGGTYKDIKENQKENKRKHPDILLEILDVVKDIQATQYEDEDDDGDDEVQRQLFELSLSECQELIHTLVNKIKDTYETEEIVLDDLNKAVFPASTIFAEGSKKAISDMVDFIQDELGIDLHVFTDVE